MKEIKLFQKALLSITPKQVYNEELFKTAMKKGYVYDPECDEERIFQFLKTQPDNLNTTFYKEWSDVTSRTRFELFVDQVRHYASTYGTGHTGQAYVPNNEPMQIDYTNVKVIKAIAEDEIAEKIKNLFYSGIALKGETITDVFELIEELSIKIDIDSIKNKEALCIFCDKTGMLPSNPMEMVRYLVYLYTGDTLLINSREVLSAIRTKSITYSADAFISEYGIEKLSSVFFRYKKIFLAMKNKKNANVINRLRRAANTHHQPKKPGLWENVLSNHSRLSEAISKMDDLNNFKKVALLQAIQVRLVKTGIAPFIIRNGKMRVEKKDLPTYPWYTILHRALLESLSKSLKAKACKVKLPKGLNLVLPTSEKNFIGNIPFGSYINTPSKDSIAGIYWREENGAQDIDLSAVTIEGQKIGWNSRYYNDEQSVVYSGDMTSARPEATELMYCKSQMPESIIFANLFSGRQDSEYTLFFAQQDGFDKNNYNYMVNPNNILFQTNISFDATTRQKMNGFFAGDRFVFSDFGTGKNSVVSFHSYHKDYIEHMVKCADAFIDLKSVLELAGFTFVESELDADIDFSVLDKSALIELLS